MSISLVQAHFEVGELLAVIRDGVDHDTAVRVVVHLESNCYSCRKALEELIGLDSFPDNMTTVAEHDIVARTLWRWISLLRDEPRWSRYLTPIHHYWLQRSRDEPQVFCRLVIEEARLVDLEGTDDRHPVELETGSSPGLAAVEAALELSTDPELTRLGNAQWHGHRALAHAYLADTLFRHRCYRGVHPHLKRAEEQLRQGRDGRRSQDNPEIRFILHLLWSRMNLAARGEPSFEASLDVAYLYLVQFLATYPSPEHQVELLLGQVVEDLHTRQYVTATNHLLEVLELAPGDCAFSRFEACHQLALIGYACTDLELLEEYLPQAEELSRQYGFRLARPDLLLLRGALSWRSGAPGSADVEQLLRFAEAGYLAEGNRAGAVRALNELRQFLAEDVELAEHQALMALQALREEFLAIIRDPDARPIPRQDVALVLRWAEEFGITDLDTLKAELMVAT